MPTCPVCEQVISVDSEFTRCACTRCERAKLALGATIEDPLIASVTTAHANAVIYYLDNFSLPEE